MFEQMVRVFEEAGMPYCILAGYDGFPQQIPSDIDFMMAPAWNSRLPELIAAIGRASGARLIQHLQHETTASYFILARLDGATITYLHPDSSGDYRRKGHLWLDAQTVLENRRRHARGFWIPSAADAFSYYLIKKLDKQSLNRSQAQELSARYTEDPARCRERLYRLLPAKEARWIETALTGIGGFGGSAWRNVGSNLPHLRRALHQKAAVVCWRERLSQKFKDIQRLWRRWRQPTGLRIVVLGPDGSGKSALISALTEQLAPAFRRVEYRHLFPGRLPDPATADVVTDPHAKPPRDKLGSLAKLLHFWSIYQLGGLLWLYPRYVRSTLVIFDRYYQDILADPVRYRYSASLPLARQLGRWLPQPDLVFILDAPVDILQSRKREVTPAESARQRIAYRALNKEFHRAAILDSSQPLDQVVSSALAQVLDFLEQRTGKRLHITPLRLE